MMFQIESITIEWWTLIVAMATFIVTLFSYIHVRRSEKKRIMSEITRKEAILKSLGNPFAMMGVDHTVADSMKMQVMMLKSEIEELKKQL